MTSAAVRVGLRVRPLTRKEELENCTECITYIPHEPQILLGTDKSFTFDYVFNNESEQLHVYNTAAVPLLEKFLEGFNATILAYGQTGSGKTYSMGTGLECGIDSNHEGIVPRCITDLFRRLEDQANNDDQFNYEVYVSFLELYNEDLIDLLSPQQQQQRTPTAMKRRSFTSALPSITEISIREDNEGTIYWSGVREERCFNPDELLGYLSKGSLCRTTASTDMNTVSSRSHAVFSVTLKQNKHKGEPSLISKFHFVDLAGSERLKRTNAQGDRAREGISINSGLLALGNVISALGDEARRSSHIPYRDSKLTRLLQDSLGGNSQTLMLACVSPADTNFMETLNTLKYANRARNIKNKVSINQEFAGSSMEVNQLRAQIAKLRIELAASRLTAANVSAGKDRNNNSNRASAIYQNISMNSNTTVHDIEIRSLRSEVLQLKEKIRTLSTNLIQVTSERDTMLVEREIADLMKDEDDDGDNGFESPHKQSAIQAHPLIQQYQKTIAELNNELLDTRERIAFYESISTSFSLQASSLSDVSVSTFLSASTSRRKYKKTNSRRYVRPIAVSANLSSKANRRAMKSSSTQRSIDNEEKIANDAEDLNEDEIRQSIAKAKAEIQRGMEVLDLMIPTEGNTQSLEDELEELEEVATIASSSSQRKANQQMERLDSDEGNYTATSSPVDDTERQQQQQQQNNDTQLSMEIQALSVPSWDHDIFIPRDNTYADSDMEEASLSPISTDSQIPNENAATGYSTGNGGGGGTSNPQFARILHQLQSDIRVKEELVSHLERSETKFIFMRHKFDEKIAQLHAQLAELQRDRDRALAKTKSAYAAAATAATASSTVNGNRNSTALQLKEKQQLLETRHAYENKMKQLVTEIHELKRNYSRTVTNMQSTRNQQESLLRSLRANVESLKTEKKRMIKRMKQETERVREQMALQERRISKLQRQHTELSHARSKLQKEHEAQKLMLKRRDKEMMINNNQLKQLIEVLKKAVREGGMLDDALLSKVSHILGGNFAAVARRGGMRNLPGFRAQRKRKNPIPVQLRVLRKKQLLDKLLYQFIQGKQAIIEMEQLLSRREQLAAEKIGLLEERKSIFEAEKETSQLTGEPMDMLAVDLANERIDLIEAEISYLSARIRGLQSEAAGATDEDSVVTQSPDGQHNEQHQAFEKRKVTFADDIIADANPSDEWADIDAIEEQFGVPANAAPELVYDGTVKLLKSLEVDECRKIVQSLVDDIASSRMSEYNRQRSMQNLEKTVQDLRKTLIIMKRAAITTTAENERRIRSLESTKAPNIACKNLEKLDEKMEDLIMNSGNTIFDKIYEDGLRGLLNTPEPQYSSSNVSPEEASTITSISDDRRSSTHSEGLLPPPSPLTTPIYTNSSTTAMDQLMMAPGRSPTSNGVRPPSVLTDKGNMMIRGNSHGSYTTRESSTPSPDRFYNMIQKRLSWQHRLGNGSSTDASMAISNPAEFSRYANDRESSTSSIRSGHLRRASVQSDSSSSQSSCISSNKDMSSSNSNLYYHQYETPTYSTTTTTNGTTAAQQQQQKVNRRRSLVLQKAAATERAAGQQQQQLTPSQQQQQQQQQKARRRASLRELSITGIAGSPMGYVEVPPSVTSMSSMSSSSYSQQSSSPSDANRRALMPNFSTNMERVSTPNGTNVFHRLAQTPTRASQAKITYRHSSSSMDELKLRWGSSSEMDRIPSAANGTYYGEQ